MKKQIHILFVLMILAQISKSQTKNLWATTAIGGPSGYGTILKSDSSGNNFVVAGSFNQSNGSYPQGKLAIASNGVIYGATRRGGLNDSCLIFSYDTASHIITNIYDFMSAQQFGVIPYSGLILGTDCIFYGLCNQGGANSGGVIYSFDPITNSYNDIYDFVDSTGSSPFGELLQLSDGKFYGIASDGGLNNFGVIFRFDPVTGVYIVLHNFTYMTGASPAYGNLIQATDGKLYGMTKDGGTGGAGVIFSYDLTTQVYANLHSFNFSGDGADPFGSLIQAANGKLYGMTITGGLNSKGILFSYDIITTTYTILINFDGLNGAEPQRGLLQASNGKLFGTTRKGGLHDCGVIFSFDTLTNAYNKILDLDTSTTGAQPTCDIFETGGIQTNPCLLGVPQINNQADISIFPNPAKDNFIIRLNSEIKNGEIEIYNMLGELIYSEKLIMSSCNFSIKVNLCIPAGVYNLKIRNGKKYYNKKLLVQ